MLAPTKGLTEWKVNRMSLLAAKAQALATRTDETTATPFDIAVNKIVDETGCTPAEATSCLGWISQFVNSARTSGYDWQYPTDEQMAGRDYDIFDEVMEHGAVATVGSAHEAIQNALLDPARGELTLRHDDVDPEGSPSYCNIQVALGVFRV